MPKLNLIEAAQVKVSSGDVAAIKGAGWQWDAPDPYALNGPASANQFLAVTDLTATGFTAERNSSSGRSTFTVPAPPAGSVIRFTITCSSQVLLRLGDTDDLGPNMATVTNIRTFTAGTHTHDDALPSYPAERQRLGWLVTTEAAPFTISGWEVIPA